MKHLVGAVALSLTINTLGLSTVHAHDYSPVIQQAPGQTTKYNHGDATTFSDQPNGTVAISVLPIPAYNSGKVSLALSFVNKTASEALIDPDAITVSLAAGKPVKIITAQDLAKKARGDAALASLSSALGGVARAGLGGQPTTVTTTGGYGRYTTTIKNPSQQLRDIQQSQSQGQNEAEAIRDNLSANLDQIHDTVLQKTTLASGETEGGTLLLQVPNLKKDEVRAMTVTVRFAGDEHVFAFAMDKYHP